MQKDFDIDECVKDYEVGNNVCEFSTNYYVKWFCGVNDQRCNPSNISEESYQLAIQNIDTYFAWIGVMEYYENSVHLFHHKFPFLFREFEDKSEFTENFEAEQEKQNNKRKNSGYGGYKRPSAESRQIMEEMNSLDIRLYDYVVEKYKLNKIQK